MFPDSSDCGRKDYGRSASPLLPGEFGPRQWSRNTGDGRQTPTGGFRRHRAPPATFRRRGCAVGSRLRSGEEAGEATGTTSRCAHGDLGGVAFRPPPLPREAEAIASVRARQENPNAPDSRQLRAAGYGDLG